jgi:hypothetical protein
MILFRAPRLITLLLSLFIVFSTTAQRYEVLKDSLLMRLLMDEDPQLDEVLNNPSRYEFQLIYTKITHSDKKLLLEERSLNQDQFHFYPASLIKLPLAMVALEYMQYLKEFGVSMQDRISIQTCSCDRATESYVRKSKNPTLEHFLRELLIMSNNDAYNLFFDLVGMDHFNSRISEMGYKGIILKNRFTQGCTSGQNRWSGGVKFINSNDSVIYSIPCDSSLKSYTVDSSYPTSSGKYHVSGKKIIASPKDYSASNFVRLTDAHHLMIQLFYPEINQNPSVAFKFDSSKTHLLKTAMGDFPRELLNAWQDFSQTPDYYYKFFLDPKTRNTQTGNLRIYNKVGLASGYLSDVSYFEDQENGIAFFISAAIFAKKDGIVGGGKNNYYDFGIPVLRKIGTLIYNYEMALKSIK